MTDRDERPPVAVGGGGGSGTRVVAEIMERAGLYIGSDLNRAKDNQWFSLLFKRPSWLAKDRKRASREFPELADLFARAMTGQRVGTAKDVRTVLRVCLDPPPQSAVVPQRASWPWLRARTLLRARATHVGNRIDWGWKNPNSHIVLPELLETFPRLRYIHVVRHGLDMAFSSNQEQLQNWGDLFGLDPTVTTPQASLRYWVSSNERAARILEGLGTDRALIVNFDDLCARPREGVARIVDFLGLPHEVDLDALSTIPRRPNSTGRYKAHDIRMFPPEDVAAVARWGFAT